MQSRCVHNTLIGLLVETEKKFCIDEYTFMLTFRMATKILEICKEIATSWLRVFYFMVVY